MNILICSLGNIRQYKEDIVYTIHHDDKEKNGHFLQKLLIDFFDISLTSIFLLDTLSKINNDYGEMCKELKKEYKEYFLKKANEKTDKKVNAQDVDVHIIPGVGVYQNCHFMGNVTDAYFLALYEMYKIFTSKEIIKSKELKVIFDISLGINYQSNILYRALNEILGVIAYFKPVKLVVVNSEPVFSTNTPNIHIIEEKDIVQNVIFESEVKKRVSNPYSKLPKEMKIEVNKRVFSKLGEIIETRKEAVRNTLENSHLFLKSIYYGLPLLFIIVHKKIKYKGFIDQIINLFREFIEVKNNEEVCEVLRKLELSSGLKDIIFSQLFMEHFEELFGKIETEKILFSKLKEMINFIWKIKDNLGKSQVSSFLNKEIKELEKNFPYIKDGEEMIYDYNKIKMLAQGKNTEGFNKTENTKVKNSDFDEKRNFLAHSGMSSKTFKILKENSEVFIIPDVKKILGLAR
ncbi:TIGR01897 family CRISPR-associated protein [Thermosipho ferrireducens]|uniref:TIGR01897 family CRISPR-associated protein n=1 Tax=Thermosipho ferrireducens TaxID=2571116 RepID=A0ABX7S872_9BACT|nr:CRISPR-associated CARF protein Csx1 [Thermosipho ferrireducens]QTA38794.1 TIGR01897 family CRISPR-associated protein [Thermosipho ferrireducens]